MMQSDRNAARLATLVACAFFMQATHADVDRKRGGSVPPAEFFSRYTLQSASADNLQFVGDPAGGPRQVMKLSVSEQDARVAGGHRSEIVPLREYVKEGVRWYAFSFFLPVDWAPHAAPILLAQLHTSQRAAVLSPPVAFVAQNDGLHLELRSSSRPVEGPDAVTKKEAALEMVPLGPLEKGTWQCFVVRADWSWKPGQGALEVWKNGQVVYSKHDAPNAYQTWLGNYPKVGIYAPGSLAAHHRELFVDYIWVGGPEASFSEMQDKTPCANNR